MKVICLLGSPRTNGNSSTIAHKFCNTLKKAGSEIEYIELNKLDYKGCQACDACKKNGGECILKDDLEDVFASVKKSDVIVLASPVYFGDVSAQLKGFVDRMRSYRFKEKICKERTLNLEPSKKLVMILSQKAGAKYFNDLYPTYKTLFEGSLGIKVMPLIRGCNLDKKSDASNNANLMNDVESMARKLITVGT